MAEDNPAAQRQTAVTAYLKSKQLLQFAFVQKAVTADLWSKQLLLFVFARRSVWQYSMAEENPAAQRQTAVTAHLKSKQLLLFVFTRYK